MKKLSYFIIISALIVSTSSCRKDLFQQPVTNCIDSNIPNNPNHPLKDSVDAIVNKYIGKGIPGIQVTIKNNNGWYQTAKGYSSIESKKALEPCATSWLFSLTKAYTASLIMKEKENGKLNLDSPIINYLPLEVGKNIKGSDKISVRMLMNHSSGLINFTELPVYMVRQFNNPADQPSIQEMIEMLYNKELQSEPGTSYSYSNSNYLLLYLILEKVSGKTYRDLLYTEIFQPLNLQHTYYDLGKDQINTLGFPNYYFDRYAKDQLENVTLWNHYLANASYSWGGIAATPTDAILFYEALMQGRVVSNASLQEMTTWFQGQGSDEPNYGLGIEYWQFKPGSTPQRGHEGDGLGNSTMILYVPDNNTYLYINCTAGRKLFGPYLFKITDFKNELAGYVARWR